MIPLGVLASARVEAAGGAALLYATTASAVISVGGWSLVGAATMLEAITSDDDATSYASGTSIPGGPLVLQLPAISIAAGATIASVTVHTRRSASTASSSAFAAALKVNGTFYSAAAGTMRSVAWEDVEAVWTTNPATSTAWTPAEVATITEIRLSTTDSTPPPRISFVELRIA